MKTWSIADALDDARAIVKYGVTMLLAPVVDWALPVLGHDVDTIHEPALTSDELIGVRGLLQERYDPPASNPAQARPAEVCDATPPSSAPSAGHPDPSSARPRGVTRIVDDEGPGSASDIPQSPESGRPTSELLDYAANEISYYVSKYEVWPELKRYEGKLIAELRDRAAMFKAIESA